MIIQNCNLLLVIISKIEQLIAEQKAQHPYASDEDIIEILKNKFSVENRS